jgi:hypothetical protein
MKIQTIAMAELHQSQPEFSHRTMRAVAADSKDENMKGKIV